MPKQFRAKAKGIILKDSLLAFMQIFLPFFFNKVNLFYDG